MSTKNSRSGGKYGGNHTTLTPSAIKICDIANKCELVTKISPGYIKSGLKSSRGNTRVKISIQEKVILLSIRGNINHQEVFIYGTNLEEIKNQLIRGIKKLKFSYS